MTNYKVQLDTKSVEGQTILANPADDDQNEMHISRITIFDRKREDSEEVNVCKYEKGGNYQITDEINSNTDNPSGRRDGLIIYFNPECGSGGDNKPTELALEIAQHKGLMYLNWRSVK
jgi:hypothetical protein